MTTRHGQHQKPGSIDSLVGRIPDRFLTPDPEVRDGEPVGLKTYISELSDWIDSELGTSEGARRRGDTQGQRMVPEVMRRIGTDPAQWYVRMLSR